ncbi:hypothetical protein F4808DRAFT_438730 [Astrocystis sublimbata]|nr:hypothetical protein F4808DRAFT_438730 [Astrocystis sublimbata]
MPQAPVSSNMRFSSQPAQKPPGKVKRGILALIDFSISVTLICFALLFITSHLLDIVAKVDFSMLRPAPAKYVLGAPGLQHISTHQICKIQEMICNKEREYEVNCTVDADCAQQLYHSSLHKPNTATLSHVTDLWYTVSETSTSHPVEYLMSQHSGLALFAAAEVSMRFPYEENALEDVEDVCTELPRYNVTAAHLVPWYDLFDRWNRTLAASPWARPLAMTHYNVLEGLAHVMSVLAVRETERFRVLVKEYEEAGCGELGTALR